jgi:hypothetical protein
MTRPVSYLACASSDISSLLPCLCLTRHGQSLTLPVPHMTRPVSYLACASSDISSLIPCLCLRRHVQSRTLSVPHTTRPASYVACASHDTSSLIRCLCLTSHGQSLTLPVFRVIYEADIRIKYMQLMPMYICMYVHIPVCLRQWIYNTLVLRDSCYI